MADSLPHRPSVLHKHPKRREFVQVENSIARSEVLSLKASGLLVHILSMPDGAPIDARSIAASRPDGRTAVLSALKELRDEGHIEQVRVQRPDGRWITVTHVYECPVDNPHRGQVSRLRETSQNRGQVSRPSLSEKDHVEIGGHRFQCSECDATFAAFDAYADHLEAPCA